MEWFAEESAPRRSSYSDFFFVSESSLLNVHVRVSNMYSPLPVRWTKMSQRLHGPETLEFTACYMFLRHRFRTLPLR